MRENLECMEAIKEMKSALYQKNSTALVFV